MKTNSLTALLMVVAILLPNLLNAAPVTENGVYQIQLTGTSLPDNLSADEKLQIYKTHALLKYSRNIRAAYDKGLVGKEAIESLEQTLSLYNSSDSKGGHKLPLSEYNFAYYGPIEIGCQPFIIVFDSSFSDLWVPSMAYHGPNWKIQHRFDPSKSKTFRDAGRGFEDVIERIGWVTGKVGFDNVKIAGAIAKNQTFGLGIYGEMGNNNGLYDGYIGLAFEELSRQKSEATVFHQMFKQGSVQQPVFGLFMGRHKDETGHCSELTLGGVDSSMFTGEIAYTPVVTKNVSTVGFWEVALDDVSVDGKYFGFKNKKVILDIGAPIILVSIFDVDKIVDSIPGSKATSHGVAIPCDTKSVVSLTIAGVKYDINTEDLVQDPIGENLCVSAIQSQWTGSEDEWLVGSPFLRSVYTAFDIEKRAVGFGKLKDVSPWCKTT